MSTGNGPIPLSPGKAALKLGHSPGSAQTSRPAKLSSPDVADAVVVIGFVAVGGGTVVVGGDVVDARVVVGEANAGRLFVGFSVQRRAGTSSSALIRRPMAARAASRQRRAGLHGSGSSPEPSSTTRTFPPSTTRAYRTDCQRAERITGNMLGSPGRTCAAVCGPHRLCRAVSEHAPSNCLLADRCGWLQRHRPTQIMG